MNFSPHVQAIRPVPKDVAATFQTLRDVTVGPHAVRGAVLGPKWSHPRRNTASPPDRLHCFSGGTCITSCGARCRLPFYSPRSCRPRSRLPGPRPWDVAPPRQFPGRARILPQWSGAPNSLLPTAGGCHGVAARGGPGAPDLLRSIVVLDDEKGILIAPVIRNGRPDLGMPESNLADPQIADIIAWLHVQTWAAGHRSTYAFQDVLTGDSRKGEAYFQTACASCHSATGDLNGIGTRFDPFSWQARWLQPRAGVAAAEAAGALSRNSNRVSHFVTVTPHPVNRLPARSTHFDDFSVSLRDPRESITPLCARTMSESRNPRSAAPVQRSPAQVHGCQHSRRNRLSGEPEMKTATFRPPSSCCPLAAARPGRPRSGHPAETAGGSGRRITEDSGRPVQPV